jgi:hypothetical protein
VIFVLLSFFWPGIIAVILSFFASPGSLLSGQPLLTAPITLIVAPLLLYLFFPPFLMVPIATIAIAIIGTLSNWGRSSESKPTASMAHAFEAVAKASEQTDNSAPAPHDAGQLD